MSAPIAYPNIARKRRQQITRDRLSMLAGDTARKRGRAKEKLDAWIAQVQQEGLRLRAKPSPLVARGDQRSWPCSGISTGFVESKDSRTRTIMRQEDGFARREHLCWRTCFAELFRVFSGFHPQAWRCPPLAHFSFPWRGVEQRPERIISRGAVDSIRKLVTIEVAQAHSLQGEKHGSLGTSLLAGDNGIHDRRRCGPGFRRGIRSVELA